GSELQLKKTRRWFVDLVLFRIDCNQGTHRRRHCKHVAECFERQIDRVLLLRRRGNLRAFGNEKRKLRAVSDDECDGSAGGPRLQQTNAEQVEKREEVSVGRAIQSRDHAFTDESKD